MGGPGSHPFAHPALLVFKKHREINFRLTPIQRLSSPVEELLYAYACSQSRSHAKRT